MARDKLRSEIRTITDKYSQEHERLQVKATRSLDELTVVFKRKFSLVIFFMYIHSGVNKAKRGKFAIFGVRKCKLTPS